jgi:hypothetical protein
MSQPFSRHLHLFDRAHRPSLEPEVRRAMLASWALIPGGNKNETATQVRSQLTSLVPLDALSGTRSLDGPSESSALQ